VAVCRTGCFNGGKGHSTPDVTLKKGWDVTSMAVSSEQLARWIFLVDSAFQRKEWRILRSRIGVLLILKFEFGTKKGNFRNVDRGVLVWIANISFCDPVLVSRT
jgi:hypothetical protein